MSEQDGQANTADSPKPLTYAGVGAVGGAGFAASIFGALGLAKILANTDGNYSPGYPIVVFGMVALFILICGIALAPLSRGGAKFAWFGVLAFAAITAAGAYVFFRQAYDNPTAYVTANFMPDPSSFTDVDKDNKLQLVLQYRTKNGSNKFIKYADERIPINGHDGIDLKLDGLERLEANYIANYNSSRLFKRSLKNACRDVHNSSQNNVCYMVNSDMMTDDDALVRAGQ